MSSVQRTVLPRLVPIEEIAAHLGVDVRHVRRLVAERRIPYFKWGRRLRFDPVEIKLWLDAARIEPAASAYRNGRARRR